MMRSGGDLLFVLGGGIFFLGVARGAGESGAAESRRRRNMMYGEWRQLSRRQEAAAGCAASR